MTRGIRIAVEGCGHGALNAIYASIASSCRARGWDGVDLVIIGGDFQAVRNASDLTLMSCPLKYRRLGDFPSYYSGARKAPYLTVFIGGNHEASSHLWELFYGGWVAPNIYYMGAANVLRLGGLRIAGLSGIWKGADYRRPHFERLPFGEGDVRSFYHVREIDVRRLLQVRSQVDVGLSHDWPRAVERHGDREQLFRCKRHFREESMSGTLGSVAAEYVMDRLRPPYWFSAHMHVKFAAIKRYEEKSTATAAESNPDEIDLDAETAATTTRTAENNPDEIDLEGETAAATAAEGNPDEIDLVEETAATTTSTAEGNPDEIDLADESKVEKANEVSDELRAQLPASFAPRKAPRKAPQRTPGQPVPAGITNKEVRFLALDKCLPGRHFLQLCEIHPVNQEGATATPEGGHRLEYDAEWLAITRAFHKDLRFGDRDTPVPEDLGEEGYLPLIEAERAWVEEHVVRAGKLGVPDNFEVTAPPHVPGTPDIVNERPVEWTNPQTAAFCDLLGVNNPWDATEAERRARRHRGAPQQDQRMGDGRGYRGRGGRGRGNGRGRR